MCNLPALLFSARHTGANPAMAQNARLSKLGVLVHVAGSRCNPGKCTVSLHASLHGVGVRCPGRFLVSCIEVMNYGWVRLWGGTLI